jgi:hypothetical protein
MFFRVKLAIIPDSKHKASALMLSQPPE